MQGVEYPYLDEVVIMVDIGGIEVRRYLVDNGSSCIILSLNAFTKMRIDEKNLIHTLVVSLAPPNMTPISLVSYLFP